MFFYIFNNTTFSNIFEIGSNEEIASTEQKSDIEIEIEQINEIVEIPSVTNAPYFDPLHLVNVAQWNREYSDVAEDECQMVNIVTFLRDMHILL